MTGSLPASRLAEAYEVLEVVRRGGLSSTFRVRHRGSRDLRCIDVLRPAPGEREALERRLDAEARPLMELRHPHLARLVDAAVGGGGEACLVREDHEGVTLRRLTGSQQPSVPLAVELLRQAADALAYLHERGRKVGDLSPEGLLFGRGPDGGPHLVLADLGLAKDWQEEAALTAAGLFLGRLRYAAPEQFDAAGRRDAPGDVYALGLVAYELLTGSHPIAGDTASSLIAGHLFRPPTDFAETDAEHRVPDSLRRLVLSALDKDPAQRPAAAVLRDALESLGEELPPIEASEIERWIGRAAKAGDGDAAGTVAVPLDTPAGLENAQTVVLDDASQPSAASGVDDAQLDAWLEEAHALARKEEFLEARDRVRQVLKVQPDHSMALMLLASLEACLKIQVEESKAHQTVVVTPEADGDETRSGQPSRDVRESLVGGTETVQLPTVGAARNSGTETVRVTAEDLQKMAQQALDHDAGTTQRIEATEADSPGPDSHIPGGQIPGGPASTERLDLERDASTAFAAEVDDDKTRPLSPELLRRANEAPPTGLGDGTTQLLDEELPGTVTLPMEQIEAQKQAALESVSAQPDDERPRDAVAEGAREPLPRPAPGSPETTQPVLSTLPAIPQQPAAERSEPESTPVPPSTSSPPTRPAHEAPAVEASTNVPEPTGPTKPTEPIEPIEPTRAAELPEPTPKPAEPPSSGPPPAPRPTPTAASDSPAASVDELGFGGAPAAAFAQRETRQRRRRGRSRRRDRRGAPQSKSGGTWIMIGAAIAAVLVFGFGYAISAGVDLRQLVGLADQEPIVAPVELPAAVEPGRLLLDARPWAEIVQITDALGEEVQLGFHHTPARYELAPGPYEVVVAGPDGERRTLDVEVVSDQDVEVRPVFEELGVDDYFRLMGWR